MSADNWTQCPDCVKKSKSVKEEFIKKYYGKLDSFVYNKMLEEVNKAAKHIESYSDNEHNPDEEILGLMRDKDIEVKLGGESYDADQILQNGQTGSSLREDYEQGVQEGGNVYFHYSCNCDCGFDRQVDFDSKTDKIIKK